MDEHQADGGKRAAMVDRSLRILPFDRMDSAMMICRVVTVLEEPGETQRLPGRLFGRLPSLSHHHAAQLCLV